MHQVPHEIFVRSYAQIAADLNLIVGLHFAINMMVYGGLGDPKIRAAICTAMANAYLLEWAHRQAHMISSVRHPVAKVLQSFHLLFTPEMHRAHHRTCKSISQSVCQVKSHQSAARSLLCVCISISLFLLDFLLLCTPPPPPTHRRYRFPGPLRSQ